MNFFKSVFSSDPDPSDSSSAGKSLSESPHNSQENEEVEDGRPEATEHDPNRNDSHILKPSTPWVGLGSIIKTFASKSESVIQTYRRDLEEFSSGLKKETEAIREVASRAVRDLPSSLEAGASAAQESLETVGQVIDDFGGSVWRGTAEIIAEGKGVLLSADSDSETYSSDLQTASGGVTASSSKRYSRFELQVLAMQADPNTFSEKPEDDEDFRKWMSEFHLEEKEEEIELLCYDNDIMEGLLEKLVPSAVDYDTFWSRYFYKLDKLKHAEDIRANLVKRVISREDEDEDLTWEVDDDEEEGNQAKEADMNDNTERNEEIREEEEKSNLENEVEKNIGQAEERKGKAGENKEASSSEHVGGDDNKEASSSVHVENINEKSDTDSMELSQAKKSNEEPEDSRLGDTDSIELAQEKKPGGEPEDSKLSDTDSIELAQEKKPGGESEDSRLDATTVDIEIASSSTGGVDDTEPTINLLTTKSGDNVPLKSSSETAGSFKDSEISVVPIQASAVEEDLGWDEIEDLGEHDDKKVGASSSTRDEKNLHKRLNVAEDDDDLSWDIEDDD